MLAVTDVADMLGISASSVRRLVRAGTLPQPLRLGGSVRWRRAEVEAVALGRSTSRSSQTSSGEVPRRRGGGGRPKGSKNKSTLEYEAWLAQRGRGGNTAA
ncbi:MAG: helix-turn-helix domain-containing protein [Desulfovibrio sp.]|nr:helix-turn-helix domain-containing protein [Desulfovibrio sp.]